MRRARSNAIIRPPATTTAATPSSCQLITETPPCSQPRTARSLRARRSLETRMNVTSAPAKDVRTTPPRRTVSTVVGPPRRASRQTRMTAASAPRKAATGTIGAAAPSAIAMTAASVAPADVPVTNGSASGFRSRPCRSAPAAASEPPTRAAPKTRGRRSSRMIVPFTSFDPRSALTTSDGAIETEPIRTAAIALSASAAARRLSTSVVRISGRAQGGGALRRPEPRRPHADPGG